MLRYFEAIAPSTAASRSASSKTMKGALPPSSSETFFTVAAHCGHQLLADLGRAGEGELAHHGICGQLQADLARAGGGDDVEDAGRDAGAVGQLGQRQGRERRLAGGLITNVQPAASAGAALRVIMALGKFHGVIAATTPTAA